MLPCAPVPERPVSERIYDAVALAMLVYTRAVFAIEIFAERYRPRRGRLLVSSHRAETDVPLICPPLYVRGNYLLDRNAPRIHFAARDDMFEQGFFAGFPPGLPVPVRRLLFPLDAGRFLPGVRVNPVPYPSASVLRVGRALAAVPPGTPLDEVLPHELVEGFALRARSVGADVPSTARDALSGRYADLLWTLCCREELSSPVLGAVWQRRAEEGTAALRRLIDVVASGEILLLFPEGRPSPDGAIGPLRLGLRTLIRRGRPEAIVPISLAYDPITTGRIRAYVSFGEEFPAETGQPEEDVLRQLRAWTPLTCGQVVGDALVRSAAEGRDSVPVADLEERVVLAAEAAAEEGRPRERALASGRAERRRRLGSALRWTVREGLAVSDGRRLHLDPVRIFEDERLRRAAREYASARVE
jgi:1-acyl-sn-glycerol-3-phosphate acyltransferase